MHRETLSLAPALLDWKGASNCACCLEAAWITLVMTYDLSDISVRMDQPW